MESEHYNTRMIETRNPPFFIYIWELTPMSARHCEAFDVHFQQTAGLHQAL